MIQMYLLPLVKADQYQSPSRFNLFPVTGLTPGNEYCFRVFAENVHGRSDPSEESCVIQTMGVIKKKQPKTKYESKNSL